MKTFDFMWPESLECGKFPEDAPEELCISNNATSKKDQNSFTTPISVANKHDRKSTIGIVDYRNNATVFPHRSIGFVCPAQLRAPPVMGYELNVAGKAVKDCGAPCNSLFFDESERTTLRYWISSWAALSVASCLFTVNISHAFHEFPFLIHFFHPTDSNIHHRLIAISISRAADRIPCNLLLNCRKCLRERFGRWRHRRLSRAIPATCKTWTAANDFNDNSGTPTVNVMHGSVHDALLLLDGGFRLVDLSCFRLAACIRLQMGA